VPVSDHPNDWDWDNCSRFKKSKFRLVWCYVSHVGMIVLFIGLFGAFVFQDVPWDTFFNIRERTNGVQVNPLLQYGISATDFIIYFSQLLFMTLATLLYITVGS
jgi:hypothetical protein